MTATRKKKSSEETMSDILSAIDKALDSLPPPDLEEERNDLHGSGFRNQQIIVLDRGWVYVGNTRREGDVLHITDARCIRRWGTTRGLGQLAAEGPTSDTVLDPVGTAIAPWHAVITLIECAKPW